jgi:hypothetical protein
MWNNLGCPIDAHCRVEDDGEEDDAPAIGFGRDLEVDLDVELELFKPTPNPFTQATHLAYEVGTSGALVQIEVYDALGRKVRTLANEFQSAGRHHVTWDGRNDSGSLVTSGVYFYRATVGEKTDNVRVIYAR